MLLAQFVFCTQLFTGKHVHFTTPVMSFTVTLDTVVINQILFKFLYYSFYDPKKYSKCSKNLNTLFFFFYKILINAVATQEHML